ncbi:BofC C-terminal domain-containing protein [Longirhabdus pacifica]|uniref:BofC C-terminal domain-containing protein n=1 Tax=Longirhabdus pacifica TaxID=2305227 RepID=UPI0010093AE5|nr:BofC C-terminal domain-containing protein [Longirhabdus pacifica]
MFLNILRKIKKIYRKSNKLVLGGGIILLLCFISATWVIFLKPEASPVFQSQINDVNVVTNNDTQMIDEKTTYDVTLQKKYLCGEEQTFLGPKKGQDILALLADEKTWKLLHLRDDHIVVMEQIADLSPTCKQHAYIGLDEQGNLSLFQGKPSGNNIIQTFFQIDIEYLESSVPRETMQQLYHGIRIRDFDEYNSVLSTFSDYAIQYLQ